MCHAWNTHWTVARAFPTMPRRRITRDERTHGRNVREPFFGALNHEARNERANQRTEHGERPTYQIEHS